MRHLFAEKACIVPCAFAMASALLSLPSVASAQAIYGWEDAGGRLHFSNDAERLPPGAQEVKLRELSIVGPSSRAADRSAVAEDTPAAADRSDASSFDTPECDAPDPSQLIDAVTSRLGPLRPQDGGGSGLTLFVAGTPVAYSSYANVKVWPGGVTDETAAVEQAAVAYPGSGGCPTTPPLERYDVSVTSPVRSTPAGLCTDYRRAAAEIEIALSRNESVARTFATASANFDSSQVDGESAALRGINLPPWLVDTVAAQTGELAAEIEEFMEELVVARQEIDSVAQARGCW